MAPKRSSPLDDPPSASSSSSTSSSGAESEEIKDHEEQEQNKGSAGSEEEEEEEESGDEEEEVENKTPPVQTPTPTATPQPQSSSGSEGSDSEFSGGTQTSPTASDFAVKPIVSKPMDDSAKHKNPSSKSPTPASKSGAKRPAESEDKRKESQKKKRMVANGDEKDGVVEEKKSAINRLWSEDDEIVVLKGMIDYQKKKGPISHADMGAFLEFIKKSLHVDVSKNQLVDKVRRLKKKYWSGAEKGEEPVFSKPHDIKCLELSKKIWGGGSSNAVVDSVKSNSKKARKSVKVSNSLPSPKEEEQQLALQKGLNGEVKEGLNGEVKEGLNGEVKDMRVEQEDFCSMYPHLQESLGSDRYTNLSEAGKNFIKGGISMIGSVKAKELEEKWKKFREDEVALYLQKMELIQEQTKLIFEAMKSSNS